MYCTDGEWCNYTWQEFEPGFLSNPQNLQPKMPRPYAQAQQDMKGVLSPSKHPHAHHTHTHTHIHTQTDTLTHSHTDTDTHTPYCQQPLHGHTATTAQLEHIASEHERLQSGRVREGSCAQIGHRERDRYHRVLRVRHGASIVIHWRVCRLRGGGRGRLCRMRRVFRRRPLPVMME